ncbi:MAG: YtoQ family protein [Chitinophagales bacterium]
MSYTVFLSGEIHSSWRNEIINAAREKGLGIEFSYPELEHDASDNCGVEILGAEDSNFWKDHKAAKINAMRIRKGIEEADIVVVRFGEKYKQWNAAFDAGYAAALGKSLIINHPEEFTHALKEVNAAANATAHNNQQVIELLTYLCRK